MRALQPEFNEAGDEVCIAVWSAKGKQSALVLVLVTRRWNLPTDFNCVLEPVQELMQIIESMTENFSAGQVGSDLLPTFIFGVQLNSLKIRSKK